MGVRPPANPRVSTLEEEKASAPAAQQPLSGPSALLQVMRVLNDGFVRRYEN